MEHQEGERIAVSTSQGVVRTATLPALLGRVVVEFAAAQKSGGLGHGAIAVGWGRRSSSQKTRRFATDSGLPFVSIEDGFLRSFGTGPCQPPLSIIVDHRGIFFDSENPSDLEEMLSSGTLPQADGVADCCAALGLIGQYRLSKLNMGPQASNWHRHGVLVVDQTLGDFSVVLGGADAAAFTSMLAAARAENPGAILYIKTHPEVSSGRKRGYLTHIQDDERTVVLRDPVNPLSLIEQMDRVYVVTSTMGFEALLAGKPVTCFGVPWYAGWGVTDDRVKDSPAWARRTRKRTVEELFAAAYIHYTRYLNPETHQRGSIFDVIHWLVRQKQMADRLHGQNRKARVIGVGFRRWKSFNLKPLLGLHPSQVLSVKQRVILSDTSKLKPWAEQVLDSDDPAQLMPR